MVDNRAVVTDAEWRTIARNVIAYQRDRLMDIHPQLELFRAELRPRRLLASALVAFTGNEDRITGYCWRPPPNLRKLP
ncbi:hypothetical protein BH23CHL8_BH23CHL8_07870 [soil metagenome]